MYSVQLLAVFGDERRNYTSLKLLYASTVFPNLRLYEDEDCSCDSSSSYDFLHGQYLRRRQESAKVME